MALRLTAHRKAPASGPGCAGSNHAGSTGGVLISDPIGFAYTVRKNGEVVITHHGRQAAVLRGDKATRFRSKVSDDNAQALMARVTGNYRRGNERR